MKKTNLQISIVAGVIVLAVFVYIFMVKGGAGVNDENVVLRDNIEDLLGGSTAYVCEVKSNIDDRESLGTVSIYGDAFRAEFNSFIPEIGIEVDIDTIWDGEWVYSWSSLSPVGSKARVEKEQITFNNTTDQSEEEVIYACRPVLPESIDLSIPEDITFEELSGEQTEV